MFFSKQMLEKTVFVEEVFDTSKGYGIKFHYKKIFWIFPSHDTIWYGMQYMDGGFAKRTTPFINDIMFLRNHFRKENNETSSSSCD